MMPENKEQRRAAARRIKKALSGTGYYEKADARITETVLSSGLYQTAESVFCYVSMPGEPDTYRILEDALRTGKAVYVPKCLSGGRMLAVRIRSLGELQPGTLSIPEPAEANECAAASALDLILVPCVSAARNGVRLGHGAGYYDRFLADTPEQSFGINHPETEKDGPQGPATMCLCYERLLADDLPADAHDAVMDYVVCESGIIRCPRG